MIQVLTCITQQHNVPLVILAMVVCGVACFAALTLASRGVGGRQRHRWLLAGAAAFGCGTWAAHFISMLAYSPGLPIAYDLTDTLISIGIAVAGSAVGLTLFLRPERGWVGVLTAGLALGISVGAMHFVGMAGVRVAGHLDYNTGYVIGALAIGTAFFTATGAIVSDLTSTRHRLFGGLLMALGICALHFTGMTAVTIVPDPSVAVPANLISTRPLALAVAAISLVILLSGLAAANIDQYLARQSEKDLTRFRQLAEATFSGVFVYRDNILLDVNEALCRFMGCERADLIGHPITEFVAPHCLERLAARIAADEFENAEFDVIVKSGGQRRVEVTSRPIEYRGRRARVTALRDITGRAQEEALRAAEHEILIGMAENRLLAETLGQICIAAETALPGSQCSILLVSVDGRSLVTGAAPHLPTPYNDLVNGTPIGPKAGSCGTAAHRKEIVVVEDIGTDPLWADYKQYAFRHELQACWSMPLLAKDGRLIGTFATYHARPYRPTAFDFTVIERLGASAAIAIQRSHLLGELISAKERAEAASRAKSEFLANMSHELRTPLNAILGFSEIISRQVLGPDAQARYAEYAHDIHDSGRYLLSLINDILDVARVEAGKVQIRRERCSVASIVEDQVKLVRRAYPEAAAIITTIPADCPDLYADQRCFGQVLINVIGNAAKFTPPGGQIAVAADWDGTGLRLRIADSGPGIPSNVLDMLGQPFQQAESAYNRRFPGTGLGLYISRSLMRVHGGELEITSVLGQGTTVALSFPRDCVLSLEDIDPAGAFRAKLVATGE